jgi:hypothetical protein
MSLGPLQLFSVTGADPTGMTDSTAAFQAAINATKNSGAPGFGPQIPANGLFVPPGNYLVSALDCTCLSGLTVWGFPNTVLIHASKQTASMPVFDFTGSSGCGAVGITVYGFSTGDTGPFPWAAFLFGDRTGGLGWANRNFLSNCGTVGSFAAACYVNIGSPNSYVEYCSFQQANPYRPVLYIGSENAYGITGFSDLAPSVQAVGEILVLQTELHGAAGSASMTSRLKNASSVKFIGGLSEAHGPMHVYIEGD